MNYNKTRLPFRNEKEKQKEECLPASNYKQVNGGLIGFCLAFDSNQVFLFGF